MMNPAGFLHFKGTICVGVVMGVATWHGCMMLHDHYPARACAARGKVISSGWWCPNKNLQFFWNQSFISQNTHFQSSISTQIGFSSNLMASGTA